MEGKQEGIVRLSSFSLSFSLFCPHLALIHLTFFSFSSLSRNSVRMHTHTHIPHWTHLPSSTHVHVRRDVIPHLHWSSHAAGCCYCCRSGCTHYAFLSYTHHMCAVVLLHVMPAFPFCPCVRQDKRLEMEERERREGHVLSRPYTPPSGI